MQLAPTFATHMGKWKRFGVFTIAAIALVAAVALSTRGVERGVSDALLGVVLVGALTYLVTFVVWPRKDALQRSDQQRVRAVKRPVQPRPDRRPVAVIEPRPAGSRPASRVHLPESPTARNSRGRRLDGRQSGRDFQWPAPR